MDKEASSTHLEHANKHMIQALFHVTPKVTHNSPDRTCSATVMVHALHDSVLASLQVPDLPLSQLRT